MKQNSIKILLITLLCGIAFSMVFLGLYFVNATSSNYEYIQRADWTDYYGTTTVEKYDDGISVVYDGYYNKAINSDYVELGVDAINLVETVDNSVWITISFMGKAQTVPLIFNPPARGVYLTLQNRGGYIFAYVYLVSENYGAGALATRQVVEGVNTGVSVSDFNKIVLKNIDQLGYELYINDYKFVSDNLTNMVKNDIADENGNLWISYSSLGGVMGSEGDAHRIKFMYAKTYDTQTAIPLEVSTLKTENWYDPYAVEEQVYGGVRTIADGGYNEGLHSSYIRVDLDVLAFAETVSNQTNVTLAFMGLEGSAAQTPSAPLFGSTTSKGIYVTLQNVGGELTIFELRVTSVVSGVLQTGVHTNIGLGISPTELKTIELVKNDDGSYSLLMNGNQVKITSGAEGDTNLYNPYYLAILRENHVANSDGELYFGVAMYGSVNGDDFAARNIVFKSIRNSKNQKVKSPCGVEGHYVDDGIVHNPITCNTENVLYYIIDGNFVAKENAYLYGSSEDIITIDKNSFSAVAGASIRLSNETPGIRFAIQTSDALRNIENLSNVQSVTFGTLIIPTDMLAGELTVNTSEVLNIQTKLWTEEGNYLAALIKIPENEYGTKISVRGYVSITLTDQTVVTLYTEYNENNNSRSIKEVAQILLESGRYDSDTDALAILNKYAR